MASIGAYQIIRQLQAGSLSDLFMVRDGSGSPFVLKIISPRFANDSGARRRFMNEGAIGMRLRHSDNVVRTERLGRDGSRNFVVLEYLVGENLRSIIRSGGPVPEDQLVVIAKQAATGLRYIHEQGIVHKDVKPDNIFMTEAGVVKVIDFGIAESTLAGRFNIFRKIEGSTSYMAPEIIAKSRPDEQSDLYAFGITLYEAATGRLPHSAGGGQQMMAWTKDLNRRARPPRGHARGLSSFMDNLIVSAIEKRRDKRMAGFTEFLTVLARNPLSKRAAVRMSQKNLKPGTKRPAAGQGPEAT